MPYYVRSLLVLTGLATVRSIARCAVTPEQATRFPRWAIDSTVGRRRSARREGDVAWTTCTGSRALDAAQGSASSWTSERVIGDFTIAAARRFPNLSVHAFEPNPTRRFGYSSATCRRQRSHEHPTRRRIAIGTASSYTLYGVSRPARSQRLPSAGAEDDSVVVSARRLDDVLPRQGPWPSSRSTARASSCEVLPQRGRGTRPGATQGRRRVPPASAPRRRPAVSPMSEQRDSTYRSARIGTPPRQHRTPGGSPAVPRRRLPGTAPLEILASRSGADAAEDPHRAGGRTPRTPPRPRGRRAGRRGAAARR